MNVHRGVQITRHWDRQSENGEPRMNLCSSNCLSILIAVQLHELVFKARNLHPGRVDSDRN